MNYQKELNEFIAQKADRQLKKLAATEKDCAELRRLIETYRAKISELNPKIMKVKEDLKKAKPSDMADLTRQRVRLEAEVNDLENQIEDLAPAESEAIAKLQGIEEEINVLRYSWMIEKHNQLERVLIRAVQSHIEPIIENWKAFVNSGAGQDLDMHGRWTWGNVRFYSPLVRDSVDQVGHSKLIELAGDARQTEVR
ncbi:MAG: hypothetical protein PHU03_07725 [Syntrophales bacterium]|nr:hypothetical protein [Syntrophales bacterium]